MARSCEYSPIGNRSLRPVNRKLQIALKLALTSSQKYYPMGCAIFDGKTPLSFGINQIKSHPMQKKYNGSLRTYLHAEMHALSLFKGDLSGTKAYIARIKADGSYGNSRPCTGCIHALKERGVKSVFYCEDESFYEEKL